MGGGDIWEREEVIWEGVITQNFVISSCTYAFV